MNASTGSRIQILSLCALMGLAALANGGSVAFRGFRGQYRLSWDCHECDGERWATVGFDIVAPHDGEFVLEMHNDCHGDLSVNGGAAVATKGPYSGYAPHEVILRKGVNHVAFHTRSCSGCQGPKDRNLFRLMAVR